MKRVLILGMMDSVHVYRWTSQFDNTDFKLYLFPTKKFRFIGKDFRRLLKKSPNIYVIKPKLIPIKLFGYYDFFLFIILKTIFPKISRSKKLATLISNMDFDFVHFLEFQGGGYLLHEVNQKNKLNCKVIATNYGADISYFAKFPSHLVKIKQCLGLSNLYSAECQRDYELALKLGFRGKFLPCNPNAGGFTKKVLEMNVLASNERELVLVKGYGGEFGLGHILISVVDKILETNKNLKFFFYSVTKDLLPSLISLRNKYHGRVSYVSTKNRLTPFEMYKLFASARFYFGASKVDGISTSFLESLALGAYPLQTDTSCANEWVHKGFRASIIKPNFDDFLVTFNQLNLSEDLDSFRSINLELSKKYLSFENIQRESFKFYE